MNKLKEFTYLKEWQVESRIILPNTRFNQLLSILNGFVTLPTQNPYWMLNLFPCHYPGEKVARVFFSSVAYPFAWQPQSQLQLYWLSLSPMSTVTLIINVVFRWPLAKDLQPYNRGKNLKGELFLHFTLSTDPLQAHVDEATL